MKSRFLWRAVLLAIAAISGALPLFCSDANAAQLVVQNSSFEDDILTEGGFTSNTLLGWQIVNEVGSGSGAYNPLDTSPYYFGESVPDGVNVAYSNGATLFQSLESTLEASTLYTLSVSVGARPEPSVQFPGYGIQLWVGDLETGSLLAEVLSDDTTLVARGTFQTVSLSYLSADDDPLLGKNLSILLFPLNSRDFSGVAQVNFDSVSLDATLIEPSPSPSPDLPVDPEPSPSPTSTPPNSPVDPEPSPTPTPSDGSIEPEPSPTLTPSPELTVEPDPSPIESEAPIEDTSLISSVEPSVLPAEGGALTTAEPIAIESTPVDVSALDASPVVSIAPLADEQPVSVDPQPLSSADRSSHKLALPPPAPATASLSESSTQVRSSTSVPEPSLWVGLAVALGLGWQTTRRAR